MMIDAEEVPRGKINEIVRGFLRLNVKVPASLADSSMLGKDEGIVWTRTLGDATSSFVFESS